MISIIISTYKLDYFQSVSESIKRTIGVEYEIISIENNAQYSLSQAYNMGAAKAQYPYLCFVHEDVLFLTEQWGKRLISTMQEDSAVGLIGVVGTKFKSNYRTTGWGNGPLLTKFRRGRVYTDKTKNSQLEFDVRKLKDEIEDVVIVDGIFLFTKQEVMQRCRFDDKLLTHFHAYDADFSLQVFFQLYRVLVDRGMVLVHYSQGVFAADFARENTKVVMKWRSKLPIASRDLFFNSSQLSYYNVLCWCGFLLNMFQRKFRRLINK